ncbi:hypothetical protein EDC01DRAFT_744294 [Geopyxis carbonaria]|nr:hypothetical protein EDC01DRAFT_744294 [Geopyxis carbonaria]
MPDHHHHPNLLTKLICLPPQALSETEFFATLEGFHLINWYPSANFNGDWRPCMVPREFDTNLSILHHTYPMHILYMTVLEMGGHKYMKTSKAWDELKIRIDVKTNNKKYNHGLVEWRNELWTAENLKECYKIYLLGYEVYTNRVRTIYWLHRQGLVGVLFNIDDDEERSGKIREAVEVPYGNEQTLRYQQDLQNLRKSILAATDQAAIQLIDNTNLPAEKLQRPPHDVGTSVSDQLGDLRAFSSVSMKFSSTSLDSKASDFSLSEEVKQQIDEILKRSRYTCKIRKYSPPPNLGLFTYDDLASETTENEVLEELENNLPPSPQITDYMYDERGNQCLNQDIQEVRSKYGVKENESGDNVSEKGAEAPVRPNFGEWVEKVGWFGPEMDVWFRMRMKYEGDFWDYMIDGEYTTMKMFDNGSPLSSLLSTPRTSISSAWTKPHGKLRRRKGGLNLREIARHQAAANETAAKLKSKQTIQLGTISEDSTNCSQDPQSQLTGVSINSDASQVQLTEPSRKEVKSDSSDSSGKEEVLKTKRYPRSNKPPPTSAPLSILHSPADQTMDMPLPSIVVEHHHVGDTPKNTPGKKLARPQSNSADFDGFGTDDSWSHMSSPSLKEKPLSGSPNNSGPRSDSSFILSDDSNSAVNSPDHTTRRRRRSTVVSPTFPNSPPGSFCSDECEEVCNIDHPFRNLTVPCLKMIQEAEIETDQHNRDRIEQGLAPKPEFHREAFYPKEIYRETNRRSSAERQSWTKGYHAGMNAAKEGYVAGVMAAEKKFSGDEFLAESKACEEGFLAGVTAAKSKLFNPEIQHLEFFNGMERVHMGRGQGPQMESPKASNFNPDHSRASSSTIPAVRARSSTQYDEMANSTSTDSIQREFLKQTAINEQVFQYELRMKQKGLKKEMQQKVAERMFAELDPTNKIQRESREELKPNGKVDKGKRRAYPTTQQKPPQDDKLEPTLMASSGGRVQKPRVEAVDPPLPGSKGTARYGSPIPEASIPYPRDMGMCGLPVGFVPPHLSGKYNAPPPISKLNPRHTEVLWSPAQANGMVSLHPMKSQSSSEQSLQSGNAQSSHGTARNTAGLYGKFSQQTHAIVQQNQQFRQSQHGEQALQQANDAYGARADQQNIGLSKSSQPWENNTGYHSRKDRIALRNEMQKLAIDTAVGKASTFPNTRSLSNMFQPRHQISQSTVKITSRSSTKSPHSGIPLWYPNAQGPIYATVEEITLLVDFRIKAEAQSSAPTELEQVAIMLARQPQHMGYSPRELRVIGNHWNHLLSSDFYVVLQNLDPATVNLIIEDQEERRLDPIDYASIQRLLDTSPPRNPDDININFTYVYSMFTAAIRRMGLSPTTDRLINPLAIHRSLLQLNDMQMHVLLVQLESMPNLTLEPATREFPPLKIGRWDWTVLKYRRALYANGYRGGRLRDPEELYGITFTDQETEWLQWVIHQGGARFSIRN